MLCLSARSPDRNPRQHKRLWKQAPLIHLPELFAHTQPKNVNLAKTSGQLRLQGIIVCI